MKVRHGRCCVYAMEYHIVWCVKYRQKVLTTEVEQELFRILDMCAKEGGFRILEKNTDLDHVHLLVEGSPTLSIPSIMRGMKGVSARLLFKKFPSLKESLYGGHLWNPSYFIATVSENTEEQIRQYIEEQKDK